MKYLIRNYSGTEIEEVDATSIELLEDTIIFYKNKDGTADIVAVFNSEQVFVVKQ